MLFIIPVMLFYVGICLIMACRLYRWLLLLQIRTDPVIYGAVFVIAAAGPILSFVPMPYGSQRVFDHIGAVWMGIFFYGFIFMILADLLFLTAKVIPSVRSADRNSLRLIRGLIIVGISTAFMGYGLFHARTLKQAEYRVTSMHGQPEAGTEELKIVLVSDIHLGALGIESLLPGTVGRINDVQPDIICIAGDIFDNDYYAINDPEEVCRELKKLKARYGVFACPGNHDCGNGSEKMFELLEQSGIKVLAEEYVEIDDRFVILGRADKRPVARTGGIVKRGDGKTLLAAASSRGLPLIVMDHDPSNISEYGSETDLVLCGHTHKGQLFPCGFVTRAIYDADYGYYRKNENSPGVIISSGAGYWGPPLRSGSDREIAVIDFISAS